jgi:hypothetical protein
MCQAVSHPPVIKEAWVLSQASPCWTCVGQSGHGIKDFPTLSVFPCQYSSTNTPCSLVHRRRHFMFVTDSTEEDIWAQEGRSNRGVEKTT